MRRVIVTGAAGFIGANLVRALLTRGDEVHALIRPGQDDWRLADVRPFLRIHASDVTDIDSLRHVFSIVRPQWVFHTAVHGAYPAQRDFETIVRTNIVGTWNLLAVSADAGVESFVHAGTSSEYGLKDHAPGENERLEPNSSYAISKAASTMTCRLFAETRNLHVSVLRLYSVYGPWEEPSRLIPTVIVEGLHRRLPSLAARDIARDFVFVDDVVRAFMIAAESRLDEPGAIFNVGTGTQTNLGEVVAVAKRLFDIDDEPKWNSMPAREWDTSVWVAKIDKITTVLKWRPSVDFERGLRATAEWMVSADLVSTYASKQKR